MVARLFLLASLACLLTVSYGLDCLQCVGTGASSTCETDTSANATTCVTGTFCTIVKVSTNNAVTGFTRGCAVADTGSACASLIGIETCTTFCNTDGCNNGDGSLSGGGGAGMIRASALFLVVSAILGAALY